MHELGIACDLVDIAEEAARQANAIRVVAVRLRLGVLSGVEKDALLFGYDSATRGTLLEGSRLDIEDVPVLLTCANCGQRSESASVQDFLCPVCGSPRTQIVQGKEIELAAMEVAQDEYTTA